MRVKLAARGGGRWQASGGYRSKFGLTVAEILRGLEELKSLRHAGLLQAPALPPRQPDPQHPHRQGRAQRSGAHLHRAGQGGRRPASTSTSAAAWASTTTARRPTSNRASTTRSRNTPTTSSTTSRRCATTPACKHPTIVSESGRAIVAYHSVLVFNVLGVSGFGEEKIPESISPDEAEQPLIDLLETYQNLTARNALESYHDAQQALDMALNLFNGGYLPLEQRCQAENLFWAICAKLQQARRSRWTTCPRTCRASTTRWRTPTSATSRSSSRCPTAGRSSSSSR